MKRSEIEFRDKVIFLILEGAVNEINEYEFSDSERADAILLASKLLARLPGKEWHIGLLKVLRK